jgi:hypothetical protein
MSNNEWLQISQQLHDELNVIKRDALMPYVISGEAGVENERELYEQLLIDVEMGSCGKTSKIGEAITAAQLYFHRYFVNLEDITPEQPSVTKRTLKTYWQWMKNYRVWEANRKVFLYPENYIRPELRDTKTPAFQTLEEDLLQGEITEAAAQRVYQKYLDEYTEVSRLTIAGGYVYDSVDMSGNAAKSLVLFGRTKTDPRRYYYRMAQFLGREQSTAWGSWLKVNTQIDADKVYPVFAFNRVFVFWVKIETIADAPNSTALTTTETAAAGGSKNQTVASNSQSATHVLRIYYTFYNLNKEWVPAQTFRPKDEQAEKVEIKTPPGVAISDIKNIGLLVETSNKLRVPGAGTDEEHENIIVQCTYEVPVKEPDLALSSSLAKKALPENGERLFAIGKDDKTTLRFRVFDHQENKAIDIQEAALPQNKGPQLVLLKALLLPYWDGTSLMTPELKTAVIDLATAIVGYTPLRPKADENRTVVCYRTFSLTPELYTIKLLNQPSFESTGKGIFSSIFNEPEIPADQVVIFNTVQPSSESPWFSFDYKGGSFLCKPNGGTLENHLWPKQLQGNRDRLPEWNMIDAAVQLPDRTAFFFKNDKGNADRGVPQSYVSTATFPGTLSQEKPIQQDWGKVDNPITRTGIVDAAYVDRASQKTYLFSGNQYFVYSNGYAQGYGWVDEGYPKLIATNPENLPQWNQVDAVFQGKDGSTYFFNNATQKYLVSGTSTEQDIRSDWGTETKSAFITGFIPPEDDADAPSVDAGFVHNNQTYLINRNGFIKYTSSDYRSMEAGYPKPNTLFDLLSDMEYSASDSAEEDQLKKEMIVASYDQGATVYLTTRVESSKRFKNYEYKDRKLSVLESDKGLTAGLAIGEVVYRFFGSQLVISGSEDNPTFGRSIHAALVGRDDQIYIFHRGEYISFEKNKVTAQVIIDSINNWSNAKPNDTKWGKVADNIARTGRIDAAFCDGEKTYLFSGDEYVVCSGDAYASPDEGYPKKINANTEKFPKWDKMDAVLQTLFETGGKGELYFFDNSDQTYVQFGNLRTKLQTKDKWGKVRNNIAEQGIVDSAFVKDGCLFLTSGDQLFRYTLLTAKLNPNPTLDASLDEFVDAGYPKQFDWEASRIDAAFNLGDKTYLFGGDRYFRLQDLQNKELQELTTPPTFKPIQGRWGNLPKELKSGLDGALTAAADGNTQDLFLFQGDRYIKYQITNENSTQPYEIEDASYEIVRLTTSTAYRLNQALFAGGLPALLSLSTQEIDDTPSFSLETTIPPEVSATTIRVRPGKAELSKLPSSSHLDFSSANGLYYWEIFFHAPFLIAQALNLGQQFEAAKTWYEYIYDPTGVAPYWKFLPFVVTDILTTGGVAAQIDAYLTDPFDPHAIAALRPIAYRKAIVMAYLDNLIDWGDMLFQQYTRESINEARMLYILTYDLLGSKPEDLGRKLLSDTKAYSELAAEEGNSQGDPLGENQGENQPIPLLLKELTVGDDDYDFLVYPSGTPHDSVQNSYFFAPENTAITEYWSRVEDRLYKIRHCLNIMGISQPMPLFEPPIDPMLLVRTVSTGAGLSSALASLSIPVPHYRFSFMINKAQDLVQKLNQFGNDLLGALERKDAEELSLLQNRQDGIILSLTRSIKEAQLAEAQSSRQALQESLVSTTYQANHYQGLLDEGLTDTESAQIGLMIAGAALMTISAVGKIATSIAYGTGEVHIGLFTSGYTTGGETAGKALESALEGLETGGDGISMIGDAIGIYAQHERSIQDWTLQKALAESSIKQIGYQIQGAILQEKMAQRELEILEQQIAHNESISTFMRDKFSNAQLYQWMASKLSALYYQTYQMAFDMAKAAEKAFQFERGIKESDANFIGGSYWDSQRKGLLAGSNLGLDLDRMEKAYIDTNRRGFEITKAISLLDLDPVALLQLKTKGVCEFSLLESLFDYDFPGHYCRQIRTLSLSFDMGKGQTVMATLTQLNHTTVLEPDPKAVKYLLDPKDQPPLTLRSGWKATQQIALSHVEEGEKNNGLFELRFDDDRYLPFENTGAVSTWRLELNGKKHSYDINTLRDVIINLKYTAEQGGQVFASTVKGLLKPYPTARFFDVAQEFPNEWAPF